MLYFVRFQLMRSLPVNEIVQLGFQCGGEGSLVCVFNTVGDSKSVSFTVHVYMIDVELSPINGVFVYVCVHVQVCACAGVYSK